MRCSLKGKKSGIVLIIALISLMVAAACREEEPTPVPTRVSLATPTSTPAATPTPTATPIPAPPPRLVISPDAVVQGGEVTVAGTRFEAEVAVEVVVVGGGPGGEDLILGSFTTNDAGAFASVIVLPDGLAPGVWTVSASVEGETLASTSLTVTAVEK
ncbi:MAG: hypothetical protein V3U90_01365 [Dehalococcoidia bacterium]